MQQALERPGPEDYSPDPEKLLKVALKLLVRAKDRLQQGPFCKAEGEIIYAINSAKHALELLKEEEPCNKP